MGVVEAIPLVVLLMTWISVHLAGKMDIRTWVMLIAAQMLFLCYSLLTEQWTQCVFNAGMIFFGSRNYIQWKRKANTPSLSIGVKELENSLNEVKRRIHGTGETRKGPREL